MKNYIRPSVEVSKFDVADIITTSGVDYAANLAGDDKTIYEQYETLVGKDSAHEVAAVFQW